MTRISIKELHEKTGQWIRQAATEGEVVITERGKPVARLLPAEPAPMGSALGRRRLVRGAAQLLDRPLGGPGSQEIISEERDSR